MAIYHNDHLGTPQKITAVNGAVVWSAKYTSFGKATVEIETVENNLRFPGQYYDQETRLHYNWFRFYEPKTGRYLREDPIGIEGGINAYRFVLNNPIINRDINGLKCITLLSFTIPMLSNYAGSELKEKTDWKFVGKPVVDFALMPYLTLDALTGMTTGAAKCFAKRKLIYEDTYERWGTRMEAGICIDKCFGVSYWYDEKDVLLNRWQKTRIEEKKDSAHISITAPDQTLANIVCTQWLNDLK